MLLSRGRSSVKKVFGDILVPARAPIHIVSARPFLDCSPILYRLHFAYRRIWPSCDWCTSWNERWKTFSTLRLCASRLTFELRWRLDRREGKSRGTGAVERREMNVYKAIYIGFLSWRDLQIHTGRKWANGIRSPKRSDCSPCTTRASSLR